MMTWMWKGEKATIDSNSRVERVSSSTSDGNNGSSFVENSEKEKEKFQSSPVQ